MIPDIQRQFVFLRSELENSEQFARSEQKTDSQLPNLKQWLIARNSAGDIRQFQVLGGR